uniref:Protamine-2 n=1 Tax=Ursus maritimus TaxID=29073 RepID=A0A452T9T8_URSMA
MVLCRARSPSECPPQGQGQQGQGQQQEGQEQEQTVNQEDVPVEGRTHRDRYHYRHRHCSRSSGKRTQLPAPGWGSHRDGCRGGGQIQ